MPYKAKIKVKKPRKGSVPTPTNSGASKTTKAAASASTASASTGSASTAREPATEPAAPSPSPVPKPAPTPTRTPAPEPPGPAFYVGIDIAKRSHYVAAMNNEGTVVMEPFPFENSATGFTRLLMRLGEAGIDCDACVVGMEATGHYWVAVFDFLTAHGFDTCVINPIQTDAYRKVDTVRMTKTDAIDCVLIADLLRVKEFPIAQLGDEVADSLKSLTRYRVNLVCECSMLKNKCTAVMDRIFPEYAEQFADMFGPTSRAVLLRCTTPRQFLKCGVGRLTRIIDHASWGRLDRTKAEALIAAARTSVGVDFASDALSLEVRLMINRLEFLEDQIRTVERESAVLLRNSPGKWLTTIPGVGPVLAAQMTGEIGDPHRFANPRKLVAYAGMDATKYQSGERDDNGHMSKRGSSALRYALMQGADGARRCDGYFRDYYRKKMDEGCHYYLALSCVARKLAGVVLSLMKEERPYQPEPPAHHLPGHLTPQLGDAGFGDDDYTFEELDAFEAGLEEAGRAKQYKPGRGCTYGTSPRGRRTKAPA